MSHYSSFAFRNIRESDFMRCCGGLSEPYALQPLPLAQNDPQQASRGLGLTDHAWSIGEFLDAAVAVATRAPTETAPDRRRQFRIVEGGKPD
jgi:hypothetical protein